jgi:hypothetical protein
MNHAHNHYARLPRSSRARQESNDLIQHLPHAAFIAIDEEMTGISVTSGRPKRDQRPCEKFPDLKEAAETYNIIQLGVALFTPVETENNATISAQQKDEVSPPAAIGGPPSRGYEGVANAAFTTQVEQDGCLYVVRRYNFYTFPAAPVGFNHEKKGRDIVMDPASVAFLKQHDMSFDKWTGSGVTYTTAETAGAILDAYIAKQTAPANHNQDKTRPPLELRRADDISFFARVMVRYAANLFERISPHTLAVPLIFFFFFKPFRLVCANGWIRLLSRSFWSATMVKYKTRKKDDNIFCHPAMLFCARPCISTLNWNTRR